MHSSDFQRCLELLSNKATTASERASLRAELQRVIPLHLRAEHWQWASEQLDESTISIARSFQGTGAPTPLQVWAVRSVQALWVDTPRAPSSLYSLWSSCEASITQSSRNVGDDRVVQVCSAVAASWIRWAAGGTDILQSLLQLVSPSDVKLLQRDTAEANELFPLLPLSNKQVLRELGNWRRETPDGMTPSLVDMGIRLILQVTTQSGSAAEWATYLKQNVPAPLWRLIP